MLFLRLAFQLFAQPQDDQGCESWKHSWHSVVEVSFLLLWNRNTKTFCVSPFRTFPLVSHSLSLSLSVCLSSPNLPSLTRQRRKHVQCWFTFTFTQEGRRREKRAQATSILIGCRPRSRAVTVTSHRNASQKGRQSRDPGNRSISKFNKIFCFHQSGGTS